MCHQKLVGVVQLKYFYHSILGGKLTSLNYAQAKRSVMLRKDIHGHHQSGKGYRDVNLYTHQVPLRRGRGYQQQPDD